MMYCKNCGQKIAKTSKFCKNCAHPVDDSPKESKIVEQISHEPSVDKASTILTSNSENKKEATFPDENKNSGIKSSAIAAAVFVCIFVAIGIYISSQGSNQNTTSVTDSSEVATSTFYVQSDTANIRSCPSINCSVTGTYSMNTAVPLSYSTTTDGLPEWIELDFDDGTTGYINKITLGEYQVATDQTDQSQPTQQSVSNEDNGQSNSDTQNGLDLPSLIKEWSPSVALVVCSYSDGSSDFGSGFLYKNDNDGIAVFTNKHVMVEETTGVDATSCSIEIPGDSGNYYTIYNTYPASSNPFNFGNNGDWGDIQVTDGDSYFNSVAENAEENLSICQTQEQTGDNVVILGYPDYAGQFTQPTATQGIISGFVSPYYTTSAEIESGNSGGVAVDTQNNCYVGIPSAVVEGNYGNLGRILEASVPFELSYTPTPSDDQICENQYGTNSDWSGTLNKQGGPVCACASGYTWNTENTACVVQPSCPVFSSFNSATNSCECDAGYSYYGGQCVSGYTYCTDKEGYGADYDAGTNSCTCDSGYVYNNGQCEEGDTYCSERWGVGAEYDYSGGGCECEPGYESNGSECVYSGY